MRLRHVFFKALLLFNSVFRTLVTDLFNSLTVCILSIKFQVLKKGKKKLNKGKNDFTSHHI